MIHRPDSPQIVPAEHLVYGSLPTRDRGYELLGRSSGCTPDQVARVIAACRRYGQPPGAAASRPAWFALRLPAGPWAVVTVDPQGADDQGRPGALIFDAVLVPARDMAATGYNVAAFATRGEAAERPTSAIPADLPPVRFEVERLAPPRPIRPDAGPDDPRVAAIVAAIGRRRRVALEADGPIDDLVAAVWARLPGRVRRRSGVATWAFGAENRFDLMAVPRLAGVALDSSYLSPEALDPPASEVRSPSRLARRGGHPAPARAIHAPGSQAVALGGMALVGIAALVWAAGIRERGRLLPPDAPPAGADIPGPERGDDLGPAARDRALSGLRSLGERFREFGLGDPGESTTFLSRLADALHYHGPILGEPELARLHAVGPVSPDAARALRWHEQIQTFRDDQTWPARFADLSLPEQLRALGRSFHLDPATEPEAVPDALMVRLSRPEAVSPSPLGGDFPTLGSYARFLARLPRRDEPAEPGRAGR